LAGALPPDQQDTLVCFQAALIRDLFSKVGDKRVLQQIGESGAGKGTSTRLMTDLVGDHNSAPVDSIQWLQDKDFSLESVAEQDPLLITIGDQTPLQPRYSIGRLLQLTGRDKVQVNRKNKKHSSYTFNGAIVINAVEMPFSSNHRKIGMERRSVLITGWRKNESLKGIEDQFTDEVLTGYTNFLLSLPEEYIVSTLTNASGNPTVQQEAARDPMVAWFMDCVHITEDSTDRVQQGNDKDKIDQLFGNYFQYCRKSGTGETYIKNKGTFATDFEAFVRRAAKDHGWKIDIVKPGGKKLYTGLALKAEPDDSSSIDHSDTNEDSAVPVTPVQLGIAEQLGTMPIDPTPTPDPTSKPAGQIDSIQDDSNNLVQFERQLAPLLAASSDPPIPNSNSGFPRVDVMQNSRPTKGDWVTVQDDKGEIVEGKVIATPSAALHFWKVEVNNSRKILIPEIEPYRIRRLVEAIA
jgi:phage/plasmid-associated DNA primase